MVRIPEEYQEVEYLESTGTQYIATGVTISNSVEIDVQYRMEKGGSGCIVGAANNGNGSNAIAIHVNTSSGGYVRFGQNNTSGTIGIPADSIGVVYDCIIKQGLYIKSGAEYTIDSSLQDGMTQDIYLFCRNTAGVANNKAKKACILCCQIIENDILVRNFIPCYRKSDNEIGMYDTVTGIFFTNQGTGTFLKGNDVNYDTVNLMESRRRILLNTPHLESLTGSALSFETDMASKLKECKIHFTPIQEGTGDPSPDNVRPIHGWDGVTVNLTGKNLFDASGEYLNNKWINNNGEIVDSLNNRPTLLYTQKIPVVSGTDYTIHGACNNIQYIRIVYYDENDNFLGRVVSDGKPNPSKKFTPITGTAYVLVNPDTAIQNIQLEKGSSATTYEPYTAQTLTIPFPQTIYGGYVDLVKGEVVEEMAMIDLKDYPFAQYSKTNHCWGSHYLSGMKYGKYVGSDLMCDAYNALTPKSILSGGEDLAIWPYNTSLPKLIIRNDAYIQEDGTYDINALNESLSGVMVTYPLATPNTYPLNDPVTIRTLRGQNNIWSDANGNIEIKYWTH